MTAPIILQYIALMTLVVGVIAYIYKTYRDSTTHYDQDTITRLKESNDILRQENTDLKNQLASMEARIKALEQSNDVLQNVVTGKETLAKLQSTLDQFLPYIAALDEFKKSHTVINQKIDKLLALQKAS